MNREEKIKFNEKLSQINEEIKFKEQEIVKGEEYQSTEDLMSELSRDRSADNFRYNSIKKDIYKKYTDRGGYSFYMGIKLSEIKPAVKKGIKAGLGAKNIKSIEYYIIGIVKELINVELKIPQTDKLHKKILIFDEKLSKLRKKKEELIKNGIKDLEKLRMKFLEDEDKKKSLKNVKLREQKKEIDEKMKNLPKYLPQIIENVNRRLILEGVGN